VAATEVIARVPYRAWEHVAYIAATNVHEQLGLAKRIHARVPFGTGFADEYGTFDSLADVFRQIAHDERVHKEESLAQIKESRFH
jgi:hypothetical protein